MAYICKTQVQEKQKKLAILNKQYGVTARFSGSNSSSLKLSITKGKIDFISSYVFRQEEDYLDAHKKKIIELVKMRKQISVNHYFLEDNFEGAALAYLQKALSIMKEDWYDNSDIMTDYFETAWYNSIEIGKWEKPYINN